MTTILTTTRNKSKRKRKSPTKPPAQSAVSVEAKEARSSDIHGVEVTQDCFVRSVVLRTVVGFTTGRGNMGHWGKKQLGCPGWLIRRADNEVGFIPDSDLELLVPREMVHAGWEWEKERQK